MIDVDGDAPWYLIWPDWGYVHRLVQDDINKTYGYELEYTCKNNAGRVDVKSSNCIWEVKYCGFAALGAMTQLKKYLNSGEGFELGSGIQPHYFEKVTKSGVKIWIMYWESEPGVILYAWGKTLDEMKKDAQRAVSASKALIVLFGVSEYYKLIRGTYGVGGFLGGFGGGSGSLGRPGINIAFNENR